MSDEARAERLADPDASHDSYHALHDNRGGENCGVFLTHCA